MSKESSTWHSERLGRELKLARWGEIGRPVLVFPTAGGDAEEIERFLLLKVLAPMLEAGKIKVYSVDSVAGRAWLSEDNSTVNAARVQNQFDACIYHEVVPAIRQDCRSPDAEIITAGASIGAFNALAVLCRHPDVFSHAICMSGTYDLTRFLRGPKTDEYHYVSPLDFLPRLPDGDHLQTLRRRFALLAFGGGRWEDPAQSWRVADALGKRGVANRVDAWGQEYDHDWQTWREMLPKYLNELLGG
jgi:esterase/lipase superfamily enzyme